MTYTSPRAGEKIDTDLLEGMVGEWQDFTPTWTASTTNPSIGANGTLLGRYVQIGGKVYFSIKVTGGSSTSWGSGSYSWALPVIAAAEIEMVGTCFVGDSSAGSAGYSTGIAFIGAGASTVSGYIGGKNASSIVSNANPQTFATGDRIWLSGTYEAA
ncbi:hypothetical protein HUN42_00038 [Streptomyces phage Dagobah]|nr:hypothetical protein HUN42_00038 [Streptomyces phage Dagobah]